MLSIRQPKSMKGTNTPEHYMQMLLRFKRDIDTVTDPFNAFVPGTPKWMIDEWVEFTREAADVY